MTSWTSYDEWMQLKIARDEPVESLELTADNRDSLQQLGARLRPDYLSNSPFPHISIDNLLPETILDSVANGYRTVELPLH